MGSSCFPELVPLHYQFDYKEANPGEATSNARVTNTPFFTLLILSETAGASIIWFIVRGYRMTRVLVKENKPIRFLQ